MMRRNSYSKYFNKCKYAGCELMFDTLDELIVHVEAVHIDFSLNTNEYAEQHKDKDHLIPMSFVLKYTKDEKSNDDEDQGASGHSSNIQDSAGTSSSSSNQFDRKEHPDDLDNEVNKLKMRSFTLQDFAEAFSSSSSDQSIRREHPGLPDSEANEFDMQGFTLRDFAEASFSLASDQLIRREHLGLPDSKAHELDMFLRRSLEDIAGTFSTSSSMQFIVTELSDNEGDELQMDAPNMHDYDEISSSSSNQFVPDEEHPDQDLPDTGANASDISNLQDDAETSSSSSNQFDGRDNPDTGANGLLMRNFTLQDFAEASASLSSGQLIRRGHPGLSDSEANELDMLSSNEQDFGETSSSSSSKYFTDMEYPEVPETEANESDVKSTNHVCDCGAKYETLEELNSHKISHEDDEDAREELTIDDTDQVFVYDKLPFAITNPFHEN